MKGKVYFIGAGPGDPELLTLKARKIIDTADIVIYAGSLINPEILEGIKAELHDSSVLNLDEIIDIIKFGIDNKKIIARLHSGDTSFFSAISEQIERLRRLGIEYEVIPGVSSAMAGAARLGQELTIPEVSQTVIFTRLEGRTPVPAKERLCELAKHRSTMVIFLSVSMAERVQSELLEGYLGDTPVVIIEKVTWPDERVFRCKLSELSEIVRENNIKRTALIYVGEALRASKEETGRASFLYRRDFKHGYRDR